MSAECQELNHLFSQCVDGNRIKVSKHLEDPPRPSPSMPPFVLDVLRDFATTYVSKNVSADLTDLSHDRLQLLLSRDDVAFSEFELLQMTMRWCTKHDWPMEDLFEYFDFSKLTDEQKAWVVAKFPVKRYIPDLVMNGLLQSMLLSKPELEYFKLNHHGLRWKKIFDSSFDRLGRFMDVMSSAIELFHRKFIVLRVTNRLTIGIYIPKPLLKHQECVVNESVRLFSFPHSQEDMVTYRRSLPTLVNYRLYFDETGFQLYRTQRGDTWIFINRPGTDDSTFRSIEDRETEGEPDIPLLKRASTPTSSSALLLESSAAILQNTWAESTAIPSLALRSMSLAIATPTRCGSLTSGWTSLILAKSCHCSKSQKRATDCRTSRTLTGPPSQITYDILQRMATWLCSMIWQGALLETPIYQSHCTKPNPAASEGDVAMATGLMASLSLSLSLFSLYQIRQIYRQAVRIIVPYNLQHPLLPSSKPQQLAQKNFRKSLRGYFYTIRKQDSEKSISICSSPLHPPLQELSMFDLSEHGFLLAASTPSYCYIHRAWNMGPPVPVCAVVFASEIA